MSESEYAQKLRSARNTANQAKQIAMAAAGSPIAKAKLALSFGKKVAQHWPILAAAGIVDILATIPLIGSLFNLAFAMVLFRHFGPKRKKGEASELLKIGLPMLIGDVADELLGSILPTNIGVTLIRIFLS